MLVDAQKQWMLLAAAKPHLEQLLPSPPSLPQPLPAAQCAPGSETCLWKNKPAGLASRYVGTSQWIMNPLPFPGTGAMSQLCPQPWAWFGGRRGLPGTRAQNSLDEVTGRGGMAKPGLLLPFCSAACQPGISPLLIKINRNPVMTGWLL